MPFKWTLMSDVSSVIKSTEDVGQAIDQVADRLDQLGSETATTSDQAAESLSRNFKEAFDQVQAESQTTGRKLGDDVRAGARKAEEGIDNFKDEGKQSIRETAASFSDVTDALDLVQEVAANAFVGFGPAGLAAGAAVAVGIGLIKTGLDAAKERADKLLEQTHTVASALRETGGAAEYLADSMADVIDEKQWFEYWQAAPIDRLTAYGEAVRLAGVSWADLRSVAAGSSDALARVNAALDVAINSTKDFDELGRLQNTKNALNDQASAAENAAAWNKAYEESGVGAADRVAEAQTKAKEAIQSWADALTDNLSVSDEGLDGFVRGADVKLKDWNKHLRESTQRGTLDVDAWAKEVKRRSRENKLILEFSADVDTKLSPEAIANFEKLPTETQAQIAKAYGDGKGKRSHKILQTLEAEAKVTKVDVDTSSVTGKTVDIPAVVVGAGVPKDVQDAAGRGQAEANKTENAIEIKTRIDHDDLQRQVDRAAASIHAPSIYVRVRTRTDTP